MESGKWKVEKLCVEVLSESVSRFSAMEFFLFVGFWLENEPLKICC
jgi:hypothetical protein